MNQVIGVGKTVEKAIEDALLQLKQSRDNVDIKVLETGGLFKKAQVLVSLSEEYLESQKAKQFEKEKAEKQEKPQPKTELPKQQVIVEQQQAKQEEKVEQPQTQEKQFQAQSAASEAQIGKEFLEGFVKTVGIEATVDVFEDDDEIFYTVMGEKVSSLIGYRGECLNSLQFLVTVLNGKNNRKNKRVRLDIDGYRDKRKQTLERLAHRMALKVQKTGHSAKLEPMTAYERRIIHTTIQGYEGITSISRGEEPHRYLIIKKEEKPKA